MHSLQLMGDEDAGVSSSEEKEIDKEELNAHSDGDNEQIIPTIQTPPQPSTKKKKMKKRKKKNGYKPKRDGSDESADLVR